MANFAMYRRICVGVCVAEPSASPRRSTAPGHPNPTSRSPGKMPTQDLSRQHTTQNMAATLAALLLAPHIPLPAARRCRCTRPRWWKEPRRDSTDQPNSMAAHPYSLSAARGTAMQDPPFPPPPTHTHLQHIAVDVHGHVGEVARSLQQLAR